MNRRLVALVGAVLMLAGCGSQTGTAAEPAAPTETQWTPTADDRPDCLPDDAFRPGTIVDWIPFVRFGGRTYETVWLSPPGGDGAIDGSLVGEPIGEVRCQVDSASNPDFRARDGDATFVPAGTQLHAVRGYRTDFRLALRSEMGWQLIEVYNVEGAKVAGDVLDLQGKVRTVELLRLGGRGQALAVVDNAGEVNRLVEAVLRAPAIPNDAASLPSGRTTTVRFRLLDGTWVDRVWHRRSGILARSFQAPPELEELFTEVSD